MQDNNNDNVQTFQYHHIVAVDVRVNTVTGEVVEVGDPYIEDTLPPSEDTMIWSWDDDEWVRRSPADEDSNGLSTFNGWSASTSIINEAFTKHAERVLPLCISCSKPIPEGETHVAGGDPCCAACWHEDLQLLGKDCEQCGAFICTDCERISDGEKHHAEDGQVICSDCLVQDENACRVFVCDACERPSDGEKHTVGKALICSDCLVQDDDNPNDPCECKACGWECTGHNSQQEYEDHRRRKTCPECVQNLRPR